MSGDDRAAPSADPSSDGGAQHQNGGLHRLMKALFEWTPWGLRRRIKLQGEELTRLQDRAEARLDAIEGSLRQVQSELGEIRDQRLANSETRLDTVESSLSDISAEAVRLRDRVVPAVVGRSDALLERLAAEIEELGSLVERMLRREPLPTPGASAIDEATLASSLAEVQPALLEAFRGPRPRFATVSITISKRWLRLNRSSISGAVAVNCCFYCARPGSRPPESRAMPRSRRPRVGVVSMFSRAMCSRCSSPCPSRAAAP
jgi:hypothetical protein